MRIIVHFVWVPTAALLLSLLSAPVAHALLVNWKADVDGAFNDATKWSTGKVPGADDDAVDNFVNHQIKSTVNTKVKSFTTKEASTSQKERSKRPTASPAAAGSA